jgi:hypothetical protein
VPASASFPVAVHSSVTEVAALAALAARGAAVVTRRNTAAYQHGRSRRRGIVWDPRETSALLS